MALPILFYYGGTIVEGKDGVMYEGPQPNIIPPNSSMNYDLLCSEIYRISNMPSDTILEILARYPYNIHGALKFCAMPITNDIEFISVCSYIREYTPCPIIELYLEFKVPNPVLPNSVIENPTNEFAGARVCNNLTPEIDDEEDEEEFHNTCTNEYGMSSVGTFDNPPADEFEDVSMFENAKIDILVGAALENIGRAGLRVGQTFNSKEDIIAYVNAYCIKNHREILVLASKPKLYTVHCRFKDTQGCHWRLHASVNQSGLFEIKRLIDIHQCINIGSNRDNKQLSSAFIAGLILDLVKADLSVKIVAIMETIKMNHHYTIKYNKAYRAKQKAIKHLFGSWKGAYAELPRLMQAIQASNPGTVYKFWHGPPNRAGECEFEGLFWAFGASISGFAYCRPVITVDGTFLTGKYQGCLLLAISSDARNKLFPLAFALVEKENNETWEWFFACLKSYIPDRPGLCIISDKHIGIINIMNGRNLNNEYAEPNAYHRWCMRHFCANLTSKVKVKGILPLAEMLCQAHNEIKFKEVENELFELSEQAVVWLNTHDKSKWSRAYDENGRRWGILTSNNAEIMNSVFKGIRRMPVTAIVLNTFYKCNSYFVVHRDEAKSDRLAGKMWAKEVMEILEARIQRINTHRITVFDREIGLYQVDTTVTRCSKSGVYKGGNSYKVNLHTGECSCRKPQIYHYPCSHIMAVCIEYHENYEQFISPYYSVHNLVQTYEPKFFPLDDKRLWPEYEGYVLYPGEKLVKKNAQGKVKRGQRQTKRLHNNMDIMDATDRRKTCSICGNKGHTKATCARRGGSSSRG
jgi:hypothetical protein